MVVLRDILKGPHTKHVFKSFVPRRQEPYRGFRSLNLELAIAAEHNTGDTLHLVQTWMKWMRRRAKKGRVSVHLYNIMFERDMYGSVVLPLLKNNRVRMLEFSIRYVFKHMEKSRYALKGRWGEQCACTSEELADLVYKHGDVMFESMEARQTFVYDSLQTFRSEKWGNRALEYYQQFESDVQRSISLYMRALLLISAKNESDDYLRKVILAGCRDSCSLQMAMSLDFFRNNADDVLISRIHNLTP